MGRPADTGGGNRNARIAVFKAGDERDRGCRLAGRPAAPGHDLALIGPSAVATPADAAHAEPHLLAAILA